MFPITMSLLVKKSRMFLAVVSTWHQTTDRLTGVFYVCVLPELTDVWGIEYRQLETQSWAINSQMLTISKEMFCACGYYSDGFLNALILAPFGLAKFNLKKEREREFCGKQLSCIFVTFMLSPSWWILGLVLLPVSMSCSLELCCMLQITSCI